MSSKVPHNAHAWASDSETLVFKTKRLKNYQRPLFWKAIVVSNVFNLHACVLVCMYSGSTSLHGSVLLLYRDCCIFRRLHYSDCKYHIAVHKSTLGFLVQYCTHLPPVFPTHTHPITHSCSGLNSIPTVPPAHKTARDQFCCSEAGNCRKLLEADRQSMEKQRRETVTSDPTAS